MSIIPELLRQYMRKNHTAVYAAKEMEAWSFNERYAYLKTRINGRTNHKVVDYVNSEILWEKNKGRMTRIEADPLKEKYNLKFIY